MGDLNASVLGLNRDEATTNGLKDGGANLVSHLARAAMVLLRLAPMEERTAGSQGWEDDFTGGAKTTLRIDSTVAGAAQIQIRLYFS